MKYSFLTINELHLIFR